MVPRSLSEIQSALKAGKLTVVELVTYYLQNVDSTKDLNIYTEIYADQALKIAKIHDDALAQGGPTGSLVGCVISIKDNIVQKNKKATAASKILEGYHSPFDSTAVQRLEAEGAIIIGRTNCDEFGMGSSNENSIYGPTKNGLDTSRTPGGSSGGAAVSVQMKTCLVAIGSDTGGSIRQPAAFCGLYGLKPTYGRISRYGLIAYASSFDQIGIIGQNVQDIGSILEIIAGNDPMDATSSTEPMEKFHAGELTQKPVVAYFPQMLHHPKLNSEIREAIESKLEKLEREGAIVKQINFKYMDYLVPSYYVLTTAEASTNLSRYDGVRYGHRAEESTSLEDMYVNSRTEGFGMEVKRRIMLGTYVLSEGYFDAYFTKAQKVRRLIKEEIDSVLEHCDFIVLPTTTDIPWHLGTMAKDPVAMYLSDVFTVLANLTGHPAINIPLYTNTSQFPLGMQIISKKWEENKLLSFCLGL